ncbi:MAG: hypothetical protein R8J84_04230 [Mariprofundales bacterium]
MLESLSFWRAQCSAATLEGFEQEIQPLCHHSLSKNALRSRYDNSYHRALINKSLFSEATATKKRGGINWDPSPDYGRQLIDALANKTGWIEGSLREEYATAADILVKRGILFKKNHRLCLPAEFVLLQRDYSAPHSWLTLTAKNTTALLLQLVPAEIQQTMTSPKPTQNELATWLVLHGLHAHNNEVMQTLDDDDWALLYALHHRPIEDFDTLKQRYPNLPCMMMTVDRHSFHERQEISMRKSLEADLPQQLRKLCLLGLIGFNISGNGVLQTRVTLTTEAENLLAPRWRQLRKELADTLCQQWLAQSCAVERPSPWSNDQLMWRLWIALHFVPITYTQQGYLTKNGLKKLAKLLAIDDTDRLQFCLSSLQANGLAEQKNRQLSPNKISWKRWTTHQIEQTNDVLRHWEKWNKTEEKSALSLLAKLPAACWLDLNRVIQWLQASAPDKLCQAGWSQLFTDSQAIALHDYNHTHQRIYLHPQFHDLVSGNAVSFPAPGWHGATQKAKVHGFISPSGEIQLPPDCRHTILPKLAEFCTLTSVEQMITLQIDPNAFNSEPATLKRLRTVLESIQKPLPQAINYQFDKQKSRKPIAHAAASSMVLLLEDGASIARLNATGFTLSQPFPDRPEIVLLDAAVDAHAFVTSCQEAGIMLDTVVQPKAWIRGQASIGVWMQRDQDRQGNWIEVHYQKTRASKPKQILARIQSNYYGMVELSPTRKSKAGYTLLKQMVTLQSKHIMQLRELDDEEAHELGLDKL